MNRNVLIYMALLPLAVVCLISKAYSGGPYGDPRYRKKGYHNGNKVGTVFYNYGLVANVGELSCEWPIGSGHEYVGDVSPMVAVEAVDIHGKVFHNVITCESPVEFRKELSPEGKFWGFEPVPGYDNPNLDEVAMSHRPQSWPAHWPDKPPSWDGYWNGYFGRGVTNADQESYFVMDDDADEEFDFYPDTTDLSRRGMGLQVKVRGFQWSHVLAEDIIFWHYEITNIGTHDYNKVAFGMFVGTLAGGRNDSQDDLAWFDIKDDITYSWDSDNRGAGAAGPWSPVGYVGYAFLESPGNPYDGIDNDGDGKDGPGPVITADMFLPKTVRRGESVVLIDYKTYERMVVTMPDTGVIYTYMGKTFRVRPGDVLTEIPNNSIDDNLNGLIDENEKVHLGLKYKDWITHAGFDNLLIDERRDDGIDNDGDWDPLTDDVGADGVPGTGDEGEGDGVPTPGEPHFDATDKDESDQIGLTSFDFFPLGTYRDWTDEQMWQAMEPGFFDSIPELPMDGDFIYGSGYFPLKAGDTQRFSMALVFGEDSLDIFINKRTVQQIYNENYNFARPPDKPTVRAVTGDRKVTLYWDDKAEYSYDPVTGYDFEGYKIYKATDPGFNECYTITDAYGHKIYHTPVAQFDLKDGIYGFFPIPLPGYGVSYFLGNETGLVHSWTDTDVENGQTYYYAVVSYDKGDVSKNIHPAECTKFIIRDEAGNVTTDINTVVVTPEPPAAGYKAPEVYGDIEHINGPGTGKIEVEIINPLEVKDKRYRVSFGDIKTIVDTSIHIDTTVVDSIVQGDTIIVVRQIDTTVTVEKTKAGTFSVYDVDCDTFLLVDNLYRRENPQSPVFDGVRLTIDNDWDVIYDGVRSGWIGGFTNYNFECRLYPQGGIAYPADYKFIFADSGVAIDTSTQFGNFNPIPVNFYILNITDSTKVDFAFRDFDKNFIATDRDFAIILEKDTNGVLYPTWVVRFLVSLDPLSKPYPPRLGDTLLIHTTKPFRKGDVFEFQTKGAYIDKVLAKAQLDSIAVVPNPYVVAASWEPSNPYLTGRGERKIEFIHLPQKCTIRIYTIRGELVRTIEHDAPINDGAESWNLISKDGMDIAPGIYFYHVEAPGIGEKVGKFAVIK